MARSKELRTLWEEVDRAEEDLRSAHDRWVVDMSQVLEQFLSEQVTTTVESQDRHTAEIAPQLPALKLTSKEAVQKCVTRFVTQFSIAADGQLPDGDGLHGKLNKKTESIIEPLATVMTAAGYDSGVSNAYGSPIQYLWHFYAARQTSRTSYLPWPSSGDDYSSTARIFRELKAQAEREESVISKQRAKSLWDEA